MSDDRLADAIRQGMTYEEDDPPHEAVVYDATAGARGAIVAALDAELRSVRALSGMEDYKRGAVDSINNLRTALVGRAQFFDYGPGWKPAVSDDELARVIVDALNEWRPDYPWPVGDPEVVAAVAACAVNDAPIPVAAPADEEGREGT